jgi:hypothetical protein
LVIQPERKNKNGVYNMRVVDRKRVLPEVTIGLNKGETVKLATILSNSDAEKEFCRELLTQIDHVLKDDDFKEETG